MSIKTKNLKFDLINFIKNQIEIKHEKARIKRWLSYQRIMHYQINSDLSVDVDGSVDISGNSLKRIPIQFGRVNGNFNCSRNLLKSLKGCPQVVLGNFSCDHNPLQSFEYSPKYVKSEYRCHPSPLQTLENFKTRVEGLLILSGDKYEKFGTCYIMVTDDMCTYLKPLELKKIQQNYSLHVELSEKFLDEPVKTKKRHKI